MEETNAVEGAERPGTAPALHAWLDEVLDLRIPTRALIAGHDAPFDYLCHAFFDGRWDRGSAIGDRGYGTEDEAVRDAPDPRSPIPDPSPDAVVWANRGGGKTFLAAVATLLDLVFKPTIEIRVLGGSLEQAKRMHAHLRALFEGSDLFREIEGRITEKRLRLKNGSNVELLAQSQTSVRGTRVQKLRCDEVELFDPDVWEAAQLTTRSKMCGDVWVPGTIECLSTMHVPYGLMYRLVRESQGSGTGDRGPGEGNEAARGPGARCLVPGPPAAPRRLFKWGVIDVLDECGLEHDCETCALHGECGGRAKRRDDAGGAPGHMAVSDAVRLKSRVGESTWQAEMLCARPRRDDCVLPEFERRRHVCGGGIGDQGSGIRVSNSEVGETPTTLVADRRSLMPGTLVAGMDFGIRAPTVILWAMVDGGGVVRVVGERVVAGEVIASHVEVIRSGGSGPLAPFGVPAWIGVDPAGRQRSEQTGVSAIEVMRKSGLVVRDRKMGVAAGLELVRARLKPASGGPTLFVHASCEKLIESLERYRYPSDQPESLTPVKDGSDHAVDALRYMIQNLDAGYETRRGRYV
ncbi:MAG: hypothetical protein H6810_03275 [Phycisphaeraceae bacterium]|nr:MAG: hypothetical protein H6810_03275 [Phycisphaeraceae bacterium]